MRQSEALYHQAYYLYQAINNPGDGAQIKTEAKEYLNINFRFKAFPLRKSAAYWALHPDLLYFPAL